MAVTPQPFRVESSREDQSLRVSPIGELDIATVGDLERAFVVAEASDATTIILDLSGLTFIDSTGLRSVLVANDRVGGEADRLRVVAGSPAVERLLDIVGLRGTLPLITP